MLVCFQIILDMFLEKHSGNHYFITLLCYYFYFMVLILISRRKYSEKYGKYKKLIFIHYTHVYVCILKKFYLDIKYFI